MRTLSADLSCEGRVPTQHQHSQGPREQRHQRVPHTDVPAFFFLLFLFTLRGFTTSSWSKSSELMTLNLCGAGWLPLPSSGATWGPEPLSVELSELLLLLGSLATELATEAPLSLGSETVAPGGLSVCCAGTCSVHPGVSRLSRTEKEEFHFTTVYPGVDVLLC